MHAATSAPNYHRIITGLTGSEGGKTSEVEAQHLLVPLPSLLAPAQVPTAALQVPLVYLTRQLQL